MEGVLIRTISPTLKHFRRGILLTSFRMKIPLGGGILFLPGRGDQSRAGDGSFPAENLSRLYPGKLPGLFTPVPTVPQKFDSPCVSSVSKIFGVKGDKFLFLTLNRHSEL
jgi:hypothetical protein